MGDLGLRHCTAYQLNGHVKHRVFGSSPSSITAESRIRIPSGSRCSASKIASTEGCSKSRQPPEQCKTYARPFQQKVCIGCTFSRRISLADPTKAWP